MKKYKYYTKAVPLPDGTRKYVRGKTKAELAEKLAAMQSELALGIDVSNTITFKDYAEQWYTTAKEPFITEKTKELYRTMLTAHMYPSLGELHVRDIRAAHVRALFAGMSHLSSAYRSRVRSVLRAIFDAAIEDQIILRSPVPQSLRFSGERKRPSHPLTTEQEKELLGADDLDAYPFIYIALHTGMRRGEVLGLMWKDIDFKAQVIHVRRHLVDDRHGRIELVPGAKTEAGVRDIPMPAPLIAYLKRLKRESASVYVLSDKGGGPVSVIKLQTMFKAVNKRFAFHVTPHMLRHTYVTRLFESGHLDIKQIQRVAGHADPSTTLGLYTHYREERDEETIKQVQSAF